MDEDALLGEVAAGPGDGRVRMAYADWLEERGDPRADYLRAEDRLRSVPLGDPTRQALGRDLRRLRAEVPEDWLARIEPDSPVPGWMPSAVRKARRGGARDWFTWASGNHFEWVLVAALAPIEEVARTLIEHRLGVDPGSAASQGLWRRDIPAGRSRVGDPVASDIPFVQLKGQSWTVAMYDTFNLTMGGYVAAQVDAQALSDRLGTLAVEFSAEDTSSAIGYRLYDSGEGVEMGEWADEEHFASRRRKAPWTEFPSNHPHELFRSLGLYLPGFYLATEEDQPCVKLHLLDGSKLERADSINLRPYYGQGPAARLSPVDDFGPGVQLRGRNWDEGEDEERPELDEDDDDEDIPF